MATYADVARCLAAAREKAGYTQADVAEYLGVTYQAVSNWERQHSKIDSVSLLKLLLFFKADIYQFMQDCGFTTMYRFDRSDYFLSSDAREVAHAYTMLETVNDKNSVRRLLRLEEFETDCSISPDKSENIG